MDIWELVKNNLGATISVMGALLSGIFVMIATNRKTQVEAKRVDLDDERLTFDMRHSTEQRFERLVAHLERQLEKQDELRRLEAEIARKEREEFRLTLGTQTREIKWLRRRVEDLTTFIRGKGFEPPPEAPDPDE